MTQTCDLQSNELSVNEYTGRMCFTPRTVYIIQKIISIYKMNGIVYLEKNVKTKKQFKHTTDIVELLNF